MPIWVDADACPIPVKEILYRAAHRAQVVTTLVAKGPLTELTERLLQDHPGARVLDARRPKLGQDLPPVAFPTAPAASAAATEKPTPKPAPWALPGTAMALLGSLLLVSE